MIDSHIHVAPPELPGVGPLSPSLRGSTENVARIVREQMHAAGCQTALAIGSLSASEADPLGVGRTLEIAAQVPGLHAIGIANPERTDPPFLRRVDAELKQRRVIALKVFLGYLHYAPCDPCYRPYYELAERHDLPVLFHTGDTYSPFAKLKYAHPLGIDEVAVDHPKVRFILAHVGNPWMADAAEVIYKNMNVWADLSGLLVGQDGDFTEPDTAEAAQDVAQRLQAAWRYAERPNRFLYGSDWPLAPMRAYRDFISTAIPVEFHDMVFTENAQRLFGLG
jgi:uncharacterized protein